ncbi:MAG: sensor histidine kinase [Steroidobacteraceae bacterium]|jgi:two-component system sensor histidine kinase AlgZ|nr:sensor histidine kinase [Steroidobacteraceae bacterium]
MASQADGRGRASFYLPDFCAPGNVLAIVLIAELVALLLTLARYGISENFWPDLARTSMFLLWTGLGSAALLCAARSRLQSLSVARGSALALALLLAVTAAVSAAAWWIAASAGRALGLPAGGLGDQLGFVARNLIIGTIAGGLALRYFYVSQQWKRNVEAEARSRIRALQARIRPHFLFNSMNTIASLTRSDPARAEDAVADLADLFRASLREIHERIPLAEEIEVARTYARIEHLRLGSRLSVDWQIDELPSVLVPALILQPLVENAVYHGIEPLPEGGTITVTCRRDGGHVLLVVDNPVARDRPRREGGSRIGLNNVRERIELSFPGQASFGVSDSGGRFRVTLRFPAEAG